VSSTITNYSNTINIAFPIAGADNDSQGFRSNFSHIQSALNVAATEISDLQLTTTNPSNLILNNHTSSELYNLGDVTDGTMVFLTDVNKPAYYFGSTWYTFTGTSVTLTGSSVTDSGDIHCPGIIYTVGLGVSGNTIIQGTLTVSSSEALTNAGAVSLFKTASYFTTTNAWTATLAAGTAGLVKTFMMVGDGGDMVITVSNAGWKASGSGTMTFTDVGAGCTLQYINSKWFCIGNNGAVFA
jgi:hypothetical protein